MKRAALVWMLGLLCMHVCAQEPLASGVVGENLAWAIDTSYGGGVLYLYPDAVGNITAVDGRNYSTGDFATCNAAPWWPHRAWIKDISILAPAAIGKRAFCDIEGLTYWMMNPGLRSLGDSVFWGCSNLLTVEVRDTFSAVPPITATSLLTSDTTDVRVILVNNRYYDENLGVEIYDVDSYVGTDFELSPLGLGSRTITESEKDWVSIFSPEPCPIHYIYTKSDSVGGIQLSILPAIEGACPDSIALYALNGEDTPWGNTGVGRYVTVLMIEAPVYAIGAYVFDSLYNLQMIEFVNTQYALETLDVAAFSQKMKPWKWAFGEYFSRTVVPPTIASTIPGRMPPDFSKATLYVPDSMIAVSPLDGSPLNKKAKELFKAESTYWGTFGAITDRTVTDSAISDTEIQLAWYPIDRIADYLLTFTYKDEGDVEHVVSFDLYTNTWRGFLDLNRIATKYGGVVTAPAAIRKRPWDVGGSTVTINIGGGITLGVTNTNSSNNALKVNVSGLSAGSSYGYSVKSLGEYGETRIESKGEVKTLQQNALDETESDWFGRKRIYDIQGRYVGEDEAGLPTGIYIRIEKGKAERLLLTAP